jgi:hypothetical protein
MLLGTMKKLYITASRHVTFAHFVVDGAAHKRDGLELHLECLRSRCAKGYFAAPPTIHAKVRARKRFQKTTVCRKKVVFKLVSGDSGANKTFVSFGTEI